MPGSIKAIFAITIFESGFSQEKIDGIVHFAAFSIVPESMKDPLKYFDNNTGGMITLLEALNQFGIKKIVFSSTAAHMVN